MSSAATMSNKSNELTSLIHPKYRADVDGLRAVAVLSVVGYHAFPDLIKGGFTGVDIFFVVSGFLISTIILGSLERNSFSFANFYSRRIRRIFPALLLVLLVTLAFGYISLLADEYKQLGKHIIGGSIFSSNFILWNESGYFDNVAETKPLLHLWSLGIEEQFYIVWPLLLWAAIKTRTSALKIAFITGILSFALNIYGINNDANGAFLLPHTRFWELLAGSALAYISLQKNSSILDEKFVWFNLSIFTGNENLKTRGISRSLLSIIGASLIFASISIITKEKLFPGWWAALPVAGSFFLIAAGPAAWFNRNVLSNGALVWVGLISFPIYLWHWPLLTFAHIIEGGIPSVKIRTIAVLFSIALAWITYKFIEKPLRFGENGNAKTIGLVSLMIFLGYAGYYCYKEDGVHSREIAKLGDNISKAKSDWSYTPSTLIDGKIQNLTKLPGQSEDSVLFIGDSLMGQYFPRVAYVYKETPLPFYTTVFASRNHCPPLPELDIISTPENIKCSDYWKAAIDLAKSAQYKKIVLGGSWAELNAVKTELLVKDLMELKALGKEIILISQPTRSAIFDPVNIAASLRKDFIFGTIEGHGDFYVDQGSFENLDLFESLLAVAKRTNAKIVNPYDYLCPHRKCPAYINSRPLYIDAFHMRADYARQAAIFIDDIVSNELKVDNNARG